ncbi:ATP-binding cassette domain-containing protein [Enterococcus sp. DIV0876]|uniref:ATP-binding cassette domain-containing protein n=1 Tax=Enterococcus sp. DIV0876 TaxID=2774633 RepID=UPI003D2FB246
MNTMLELKQVSITLHEKRLLDNVSLKVEQGAFYCLIGESGGGKTLIGKALLRHLPRSLAMEGEIIVNSQQVEVILQHPLDSLAANVSILAQLRHLLRGQKIPKAEWEIRMREALMQVGLVPDEALLRKRPYQLSGGMCQKIVLACALITKPEVIIADEATSALDVESQKLLLQMLKKLQIEEHCTIFFITHDLDLARTYSTNLGIVKEGQLIESGKTEDILNDPQQKYTKELIDIFES